jgi:sarcosine oxidase
MESTTADISPGVSGAGFRHTHPDVLHTELASAIARQSAPLDDWDVIVIGVGSMGAATCLELARRGCRVLGIERFDIPHDRGSHGGQSRIIRKAYYEHPGYVPLLEAAYHGWRRLEEETGERVYHPTGLLYFGEEGHPLIRGLRLSASTYGVPVHDIPGMDAESRHPAFRIPDGFARLVEPAAGFLTPERCILLQARRAMQLGAHIRTRESVVSWSAAGAGVEVVTDVGRYRASRLVITAGPWAGRMVPRLSGLLRVTRQVLAWVEPSDVRGFEPGAFPCWTLGDAAWPGIFYGFPMLDAARFGGPAGLKLAHHAPAVETDPERVVRVTGPADLAPIRYFLDTYMPGVEYRVKELATCLYTNTPDEHFILDLLPGHGGRVAVAAGFSGHGFKFCSVVGEVMADLAMAGRTGHPIGFLGLGRWG